MLTKWDAVEERAAIPKSRSWEESVKHSNILIAFCLF